MTSATVTLFANQISGEVLYNNKCASCHGLNGQKKALNVSRALNTLSEEEIRNALNTYKNGTYEGKFKSVKRPIASKLSEGDIDTIVAYLRLL